MPSLANDGEDQGTSPVNVPPTLANQNGVKRKVRTKKKKGVITANVAGTKYEIVRIVIGELAFHKTRDEDETANLIWSDSAVQHEKIAELRNYQVEQPSGNAPHTLSGEEESMIREATASPAFSAAGGGLVRSPVAVLRKLLCCCEEDILDLLEQCELDDEKLMGKTSRQRGTKALSSMPESSPAPRRHRDYDDTSGSCDGTSSSGSDGGEDEGSAGEHGLRGNSASLRAGGGKRKPSERSSRVHWKPCPKPAKTSSPSSPTLSGLIRRSVSCPRSISSLTAQSPVTETRGAAPKGSPLGGGASAGEAGKAGTAPAAAPLRSHSALRSHSLSRSGSAHRVPHSSSLGTIHSNMAKSLLNVRSEEQEAELTRQTLVALGEMRVRFPGKSDEEGEAVLEQILNNWKYHKPKVASYWLVKLDATKQRKVLDIVRTNVRSALQRIWREADVDSLRMARLFSRVFTRLLWSHGQGLWNCFCSSGSSWENIFCKSGEVVSTHELQCCQRVVQLCRDCLLVVYKFVSDSRGSLAGLGPDWDDTRYLLPVTSQFIVKWPSPGLGRGRPSARSRSLFTARMGHF
ncbi:tubulin polyglutamylase TTLL7 [Brachyhypopomus gauderio]|uniref:tubulin polyglutamylase TTLL7 n=1 Tax=Brachyhypopomus gauderio TaxID=698409 RepID=UPI004041D0B9